MAYRMPASSSSPCSHICIKSWKSLFLINFAGVEIAASTNVDDRSSAVCTEVLNCVHDFCWMSSALEEIEKLKPFIEGPFKARLF